MKKTFCLIVLCGLVFLASCTPTVQHADPFYNYNDVDFPRDHLPLINPVEATRERPSSPWSLKLLNAIHIDLPRKYVREVYIYYRVGELEKFAVENGAIMAYSSYVDKDADAYIQDNFFHWFVMVPDEEITKGFQTEDAFLEYIQTLGVEDPDWQTPDEAFDTFLETGCLAWIPDCE